MRRAAIVSILIASFAGRGVMAADSPADQDLWRVKPAIQVGAHAETGGGVLPGAGFDASEQGGGIALALSFMAQARPRLLAGLVGKMTHARAALEAQTAIGVQTYNVASVRAMARAEFWSHAPSRSFSACGSTRRRRAQATSRRAAMRRSPRAPTAGA